MVELAGSRIVFHRLADGRIVGEVITSGSELFDIVTVDEAAGQWYEWADDALKKDPSSGLFIP